MAKSQLEHLQAQMQSLSNQMMNQGGTHAQMAQMFMQNNGMNQMPHMMSNMLGSQMPGMPGMPGMHGMNFGNDMVGGGHKLLKTDEPAPPKAPKKAKARRTG